MNFASPQRTRSATTLVGGLLSLATLFGGCIYDPDERCGENFELKGDACVCKDGLNLTEKGTCVGAAEGIGEECSDDSDCFEDGADTCITDDSGSYCTVTGCASSVECPNPYGCEAEADTPYCGRAPSGFEEECSEQSDCEDFEANYCETMLANSCQVECSDDPSACHGDWGCCDFSSLIGVALCVSPNEFTDGDCPFGGELLEAE